MKSSKRNTSDHEGSVGASSSEEIHLNFDRDSLAATHPIFTQKFWIPTPPILTAFKIMARTIAVGAPCCAFSGFPRFGKTWAAEYCKKELSKTFPTLPIVLFIAHDAQRPNKQYFNADALEQIGIGDGKVKRDIDMRRLVVNACWTLAQDKGSSRLALILDETQKLKTDELSWLIDVTNDLQRREVRTTSILFGQTDLEARRTVLRETHRGDILGRFMLRVNPFDGIKSAYELRQVMCYYDDAHLGETDYPLGSGCSYTRFFVPVAYENGWRLNAHADACWEQFCAYATTGLRSAKKIQQLSVGMEYVTGAIREVLTTYGKENDHAALRIPKAEWREAVEMSGFPDTLGSTYDPPLNSS